MNSFENNKKESSEKNAFSIKSQTLGFSLTFKM